jgi:predicted RNA-binding Zn-ribbon protein involved in translation (DUF1610 family)
MTIRVVCTKCHRDVKAPDEALGKKIRCPQCGQVVKVEKWHAKASGVDMAPEKPSRGGTGKWIAGAVVLAVALGIAGVVVAKKTGSGTATPGEGQPPTDAAPADGPPAPGTKSAELPRTPWTRQAA